MVRLSKLLSGTEFLGRKACILFEETTQVRGVREMACGSDFGNG